jgi:hypothetical protein
MKVIVKGTFESSKENLNLFLKRETKINFKKIINILKFFKSS